MRDADDGAVVMESLAWGAAMLVASLAIGAAVERMGLDIVDRIGRLIGV